MQTLAGKVALITGASAPNGIGRAITHGLSAGGAAVIVTELALSNNCVAALDKGLIDKKWLLTASWRLVAEQITNSLMTLLFDTAH